jgi:hypothetical protein
MAMREQNGGIGQNPCRNPVPPYRDTRHQWQRQWPPNRRQ